MSFIDSFIDPSVIIKTLGLIGIFLIIFAESGLFIGFFLPGDSLLFTAGFLASQGLLPLGVLVVGTCLMAILGDSVGYAFGKKVGPALFSRENSFFFNKKYPEQAKAFYERHGKKTIIFARFIPVVRTFAPIVAGVAGMKYRDFLSYNIIGGILWPILLIGAGVVLGKSVPNAEQYITPIVICIVIISFAPGIFHLIKSRKNVV